MVIISDEFIPTTNDELTETSTHLNTNKTESASVNDANSNVGDDLEDSVELNGESENERKEETRFQTSAHQHEIPQKEEACSYCGIDSPKRLLKCNICNKWFCNRKPEISFSSTTGNNPDGSNENTAQAIDAVQTNEIGENTAIGPKSIANFNNRSSSHIVNHLVLSHHNTVSCHEDSDFGSSVLECYNCGCTNAFLLGFVPAKSDVIVVILCRIPCGQQKNSNWDTDKWQPLIENKQFIPWLCELPSAEQIVKSNMITLSQISKLEAKWRLNQQATIMDILDFEEVEDEVIPILMRYHDAFQYQRSFAPLVKLEADSDKSLKESQALEHISVTWHESSLSSSSHEADLPSSYLASFSLSTYESSGLKVAVGDEMILRYNGPEHSPWEASGYIIKLPNAHRDQFTLELKKKPPMELMNGFTAEFVWKGIPYDRMQEALKKFAVNKKSTSGYLYYSILGHEIPSTGFDSRLPASFSIPGFPCLNQSQETAIRSALQKPLSLIQGPPGTGKTFTSATLVYHLVNIHKEKVMVCAPSNVAVDHLAMQLLELGLKVVRLTAKSREDIESSVSQVALHNLVLKAATGEFKGLLNTKQTTGELNNEQYKKLVNYFRKYEASILKNADVVCCTCVGAGDKRLGSNFRTVLIDESAQAAEPECLIPIVKGARQVVLVGDHQQLGPIILNRKAADAGLKQSLFERLILLGHIPHRLEVQYRMHPNIAEFSSIMFYEGSLQNGVTMEQRTLPRLQFPWPSPSIPMMFWANYGREELSTNGTSYLNRIEAMNCERIITKLLTQGIKPEQIGVITPYEGQRAYIVQYMQLTGSMNKDLYMDVEVSSVDAFQGREKDFIIFSCVRSNDQDVIGFLKDPRRLNVALTRSRYGLAILGNPRSLSRNVLWNHLLTYFRSKGCLVEGSLENLQMCTIQLNKASTMKKYEPQTSYINKYTYEGDDAITSNAQNERSNSIDTFDTHSLLSFNDMDMNDPASLFQQNNDLSSFLSKNFQNSLNFE